jgi:hypothetical protein
LRWTRWTWEKLATVPAVISLIDLNRQASLIHWIVEKYAIIKNWLFGWLPFHVPPSVGEDGGYRQFMDVTFHWTHQQIDELRGLQLRATQTLVAVQVLVLVYVAAFALVALTSSIRAHPKPPSSPPCLKH